MTFPNLDEVTTTFVKLEEALQEYQNMRVILNLAMPLHLINEQIKGKDLEDRNLLVTLGYIVGVIRAIHQHTYQPPKCDEVCVVGLFCKASEDYLSEVQGLKAFLTCHEALGFEGNVIGTLQSKPSFVEGAKAGECDYVRFTNDKHHPVSLVALFGEAC